MTRLTLRCGDEAAEAVGILSEEPTQADSRQRRQAPEAERCQNPFRTIRVLRQGSDAGKPLICRRTRNRLKIRRCRTVVRSRHNQREYLAAPPQVGTVPIFDLRELGILA